MKPVRESIELSMLDIVLSGSFYFRVEGITPKSFVGVVWNEQAKQWGRAVSIPVPSPTHTAYLLEEWELKRLFPQECD
ncbi:hypothetical protein SEA_LILMARTIN_253 [Streptomyces phage LilMartin]|nr:hypothetical protein SEA_LILMARTIN_1 [Streptomyces phage LilMartin]QNN98461.1 hypothetical protein SEA_LILMARTIN_253 [Streptomyces phage LilMartin]QNO12426.1 hypothetical protein SEA_MULCHMANSION_1 [Streptomyces phage MulchMansion]QNO12640.1 hypothetical protein SEA_MULCHMANSION_257 [Streptomyces phage MulchMansion]